MTAGSRAGAGPGRAWVYRSAPQSRLKRLPRSSVGSTKDRTFCRSWVTGRRVRSGWLRRRPAGLSADPAACPAHSRAASTFSGAVGSDRQGQSREGHRWGRRGGDGCSFPSQVRASLLRHHLGEVLDALLRAALDREWWMQRSSHRAGRRKPVPSANLHGWALIASSLLCEACLEVICQLLCLFLKSCPLSHESGNPR